MSEEKRRFEVLTGRWGCYFHDNTLGKSIPLQEVVNYLNTYYYSRKSLLNSIIKDLKKHPYDTTVLIEKYEGKLK